MVHENKGVTQVPALSFYLRDSGFLRVKSFNTFGPRIFSASFSRVVSVHSFVFLLNA